MLEFFMAMIVGASVILLFLLVIWLLIVVLRSLRCLIALLLIIMGICFLGTLIIKQMNYYDKIILQRGQE
jgi:hypothetical protein